MEYSFTYLLDLIGAFLLGMFVADKIIFYRIRKALEEAGVDFEEGEESVQVVTVKKYFVEKINESLYLYEHDTKNFIGQGKSLADLAVVAKSHGKIAGVSYNEEVLWFVDGEVKKTV